MNVPDTEHTQFEGQTKTQSQESTTSFNLERFLHYCGCNDCSNPLTRNVSVPQVRKGCNLATIWSRRSSRSTHWIVCPQSMSASDPWSSSYFTSPVYALSKCVNCASLYFIAAFSFTAPFLLELDLLGPKSHACIFDAILVEVPLPWCREYFSTFEEFFHLVRILSLSTLNISCSRNGSIMNARIKSLAFNILDQHIVSHLHVLKHCGFIQLSKFVSHSSVLHAASCERNKAQFRPRLQFLLLNSEMEIEQFVLDVVSLISVNNNCKILEVKVEDSSSFDVLNIPLC